MSNIICDKEGYALSLNDRVKVETVCVKPAECFIGQISGFNPLATYAIRVSNPDGTFNWYRRSEVRKLANRTTTDAKIKARPFRRA